MVLSNVTEMKIIIMNKINDHNKIYNVTGMHGITGIIFKLEFLL